MPRLPNIVCVGGGTGTFVVLKGLKFYPSRLTAIVAMSDSGGSNKRIRDEFGLLPTSDIRQCLVALSDENGGAGLLRKLFMYRFEKGNGLTGMTFGNLFMAALSDILGSQADAIRQTGKVLRIHGTVIPVSYTKTNLYARYEDGNLIKEEHLIDEPTHNGKLKILKIYLKPNAQANPEAIKRIKTADLIILGPGDLYTSLIPNLLVKNIPQAIIQSKAKVVYVLNLMTKYGQTFNFTALDHLKALERFLGKRVNFVVVHEGKINQNALKKYEKYEEVPIVDDLSENDYYKVIRENVAAKTISNKSSADQLVRSLIRHDSKKLAETLISVLKND